MDASAWITIAIAVGSSLLTYGAMRQKVMDLERRVGAVEGHDRAVIRLEVQVENLIDLVRKLDSKLSDVHADNKPAPRSRTVK